MLREREKERKKERKKEREYVRMRKRMCIVTGVVYSNIESTPPLNNLFNH
jgi:hypothetical protein